MSTASPARGRVRRRQVVVLCLLLTLLGVVGRLIWVHASAWAYFDRGRAALEDDPAAARGYLDRCLETWPDSGEVHFLAGQAARRCGDLPAARLYLDAATRCGWAESAVEVERALIRVQSGQLAGQEPLLLRCVHDGHPDTPHIIAVLLPTYMAQFRWVEADQLARKWVELRPESARAWGYSGEILERLRKKNEAVDAFRRAVELAPDDRRARFNLARMLLESRQLPEEAAGHLEWLNETDPGDRDVLVQLAVCRQVQARPDEAAALLDRVLAGDASHPRAFHHRGRLELDRGRPAEAVGFLRRAAALDPSDPEILFSLVQCLRQAGTPDEVRETEERWKRCSADLQRVTELGRAISSAPHDPDLRREIGELFLQNGRDQDGLRWLESALLERPDHAPTHRTLAAYFERTGRPDLAATHRAYFALPAGRPGP